MPHHHERQRPADEDFRVGPGLSRAHQRRHDPARVRQVQPASRQFQLVHELRSEHPAEQPPAEDTSTEQEPSDGQTRNQKDDRRAGAAERPGPRIEHRRAESGAADSGNEWLGPERQRGDSCAEK